MLMVPRSWPQDTFLDSRNLRGWGTAEANNPSNDGPTCCPRSTESMSRLEGHCPAVGDSKAAHSLLQASQCLYQGPSPVPAPSEQLLFPAPS